MAPRGLCGFKWRAPHLEPPPSKKVTSREQVCILPKHHKGDHEAVGKVTAPNKEEGGSCNTERNR